MPEDKNRHQAAQLWNSALRAVRGKPQGSW